MKKLLCLILAILLCLASCAEQKVLVAEEEIVETKPEPVIEPEIEAESEQEPPIIKHNYYNGAKVQPEIKSEHQYLFDAYDKSVDGIAGYFEVLDLGGKRYVLATLKDHW